MAAPISIAIMSMALSIISDGLEDPSGNGIFVSPVSVYSAMALALNAAGSGSQCHAQIQRLLSGPSTVQDAGLLSEPELNEGLSKLAELMRSGEGQNGSTIVAIANSVWTKAGGEVHLHKEFADLMASLFQAQVAEATSTAEINTWVSNVTQGKIPDLLVPTPDFECVLANSLYFKGLWEKPFDVEKTQNKSFTTLANVDKQVPMMVNSFSAADRVQAFKSAGAYNAVYLPYRGEKYKAYIALPEALGVEGLKTALKALTSPAALKEEVRAAKVVVHLPRFKVEYTAELSPVLRAMGVEDMFISGKSDFSRLTDDAGLYVSSVVHKCVVEVDEEGTVAAAATAIFMLTSTYEPLPLFELIFNRPFYFVIEHVDSETPLFIGAVLDPSA